MRIRWRKTRPASADYRWVLIMNSRPDATGEVLAESPPRIR